MKISKLDLYPYALPLTYQQIRCGSLLRVTDDQGNIAWGDIAPLPKWSQETLEACVEEFQLVEAKIRAIDWAKQTCLERLSHLRLLPALSFGLESALLSLLDPLSSYTIPTSALLLGSPQEILVQAKQKKEEGYTSAKVKVGHLSMKEAKQVIDQLKDIFRLRVDVNRAWETSDSLRFFAQFPLDAFDYVEEPFHNPHDLLQFSHPFAVDESYPQDLSLEKLESLPSLKALIYKPTIQGGLLHCLPLHQWTRERGLSLILSSSFESDVGLAYIASLAKRLSLITPIGIGTYDYLEEHLCMDCINFFQSTASITHPITPKKYLFSSQ